MKYYSEEESPALMTSYDIEIGEQLSMLVIFIYIYINIYIYYSDEK